MAYFLFKCWHERLFCLNTEDFVLCEPRVKTTLVPIDKSNASLVRELRGEIFAGQFLSQLDGGDFGYYAYVDGLPVGYGWVKRPGADDYFFKVRDGARYLCRFFVCESMRGKGIYPFLITSLIAHEGTDKRFYIAVERGNESSERGLKKVGFKFKKEYGFVRGFKHTFNKETLV